MSFKKSSNGLSRRQFLQVTGALAAMSGVALTPLMRALAQDATTLQVLFPDWGGNYNDLMKEIGVAFTADNPGTDLNWDFTSDYNTKLLTLIGGGTPPDIALTYEPQALATLGALIPLDDYVAAAGVSRDDFPAPLWDQAIRDGKLYALPGGADFLVTVYSKDIYRDAGLDPEQPPRTTQELMDNSMAILQKASDGTVTRVGFLPNSGQLHFWAYIFGGSFYDAENQKITANDPGIVASYEYQAQFVQAMGADQYLAFSQLPGVFEPGNPFASNQLAHFWEGFWVYDALDTNSPDVDYGMGLWPTLEDTDESRANSYMTGGWLIGIPTGSVAADKAWDFMQYAFIEKAAQMGVSTVNQPAYKPATADWEAGLMAMLGPDNRMNPYLPLFGQTASFASKARPATPVSAFYTSELVRAFDAVMVGEKSAQAALDEATVTVQAELDRVLASQA